MKIEKKQYYIEENGGIFGSPYESKKLAIDIYLKHIKDEENLSQYWSNHANKHREYIKNGKVKVVEIITISEIQRNEEILEEE